MEKQKQEKITLCQCWLSIHTICKLLNSLSQYMLPVGSLRHCWSLTGNCSRWWTGWMPIGRSGRSSALPASRCVESPCPVRVPTLVRTLSPVTRRKPPKSQRQWRKCTTLTTQSLGQSLSAVML